MTARDTIEAELKQMVFDLLHEQDMDDLKDGEKKALFSRLLKGDAEP